jgi:hypothetical protein
MDDRRNVMKKQSAVARDATALLIRVTELCRAYDDVTKRAGLVPDARRARRRFGATGGAFTAPS